MVQLVLSCSFPSVVVVDSVIFWSGFRVCGLFLDGFLISSLPLSAIAEKHPMARS